MDQDTVVDKVEKLIQLALKNPNREEAASAALMAVQLIDKFTIPIGTSMGFTVDKDDWVPPDKDVMDVMNDILSGKDPHKTGEGYEGGLMIQDREAQTGRDAWRQRMIDAWRALREERKRFEALVYRLELRYRGERFWDGLVNRKPWE